MKKVLSLIACLALLASLLTVAGAENVVVEAVPNEGQFEGQELSILVSADWMGDRYDETIARFEDFYGVTVDLQTLPADQYLDVLTSDLANGTCPDVFWIRSNPVRRHGVQHPLAIRGRCIDFTGADWQNVMPEARQAACIAGGKLYGLQIWHNSPEYVMVCSESLFGELGLILPTTPTPSSRTFARRSPSRASPPGSWQARTAGVIQLAFFRSAACMRKRLPACTTL